jgi:hypothetical protein
MQNGILKIESIFVNFSLISNFFDFFGWHAWDIGRLNNSAKCVGLAEKARIASQQEKWVSIKNELRLTAKRYFSNLFLPMHSNFGKGFFLP